MQNNLAAVLVVAAVMGGLVFSTKKECTTDAKLLELVKQQGDALAAQAKDLKATFDTVKKADEDEKKRLATSCQK